MHSAATTTLDSRIVPRDRACGTRSRDSCAVGTGRLQTTFPPWHRCCGSCRRDNASLAAFEYARFEFKLVTKHLRALYHFSSCFFQNPNYSRHSRRTTTKFWKQFKRDLVSISSTTSGLHLTGSSCDAGDFRPRCHFPQDRTNADRKPAERLQTRN